MAQTDSGHRRAVSAASFGIFLSRVLGYVRDTVIIAVFGAGGVTDAYLIAFLIPNFFRRLAGEGALSASFIPIFAAKEKTDREEAERFAGATMSFMFVILLGVCILAAIFSGTVVSIFAPGLRKSPEIFELASHLLGALFPYLLMMSLYAIISGILNTRDRFGIPASASALENISVIAAAMVLVPMMGDTPERRIWGLVIGVLVGGVLQVGVVWASLRRTGFTFRPSLRRSPELTEMLCLMLPAAVTLVIYQFNNIINQNIASFLSPGTITTLYLAYRVIEFPSALFGTAVGTVTLPKAAQAADDREFRQILARSVRMCLLWMIPSMAAFIAFSDPLIGLLFQYGRFTAESAQGVANVLRAYALALPFIGLGRILSSACYSVKSPKVPLWSGGVSVLTNVIVSILLVIWLPVPYKACGIAMGMSVAAAANFGMLLSMGGPVLRGFTMNGVAAGAGVYLTCSACFAVPLAFLSPHLSAVGPVVQKIAAGVLVFASMGIYFGLLKLILVPKMDAEK